MANDRCKRFLKAFRKQVNAKVNEKIDKRYHGWNGWLAPNDRYYDGHCGYCAELKYLQDIYK